MSSTLSSPQVGMNVTANLASSAGAGATTTVINDSSAFAPTVGSSAGNVNRVYTSAITVAASGTALSVDLTNLSDPQGNAISISTLNVLKLSNSSTTAGQDMLLSTTIANQLMVMTGAKIPAGVTPGVLCLSLGTTGLAVDATHKILLIDIAAGTNVVGQLTLIGK